MRLLALMGILSLGSGEATADEEEADTCLRTKIWEGYNEGWAVRTATSATLEEGGHRIYVVTMYAGNEYRLQVCGDANANNLDIVLHDANGTELMRDESADREPLVNFKPSSTDTYYIAVYAGSLAKGQDKAGVAMAVTYK
tara:strand:+ start:246 stop:668 length:423 start_codon:yes stop_codon:yes gene_type:complete